MPRSGEEARQRLRQAALELFGEQGYDATTAAQIAARAGVTERTFFRHFADKREALFGGDEVFRDVLADRVASAPAAMGPIAALLHAFRSVGPLLQEKRAFTEPRQKVIDATPALQERVLTKTAGLVVALSVALRQRGLDEATAGLPLRSGWRCSAALRRRGWPTRAWVGKRSWTTRTPNCGGSCREHSRSQKLAGMNKGDIVA